MFFDIKQKELVNEYELRSKYVKEPEKEVKTGCTTFNSQKAGLSDDEVKKQNLKQKYSRPTGKSLVKVLGQNDKENKENIKKKRRRHKCPQKEIKTKKGTLAVQQHGVQ